MVWEMRRMIVSASLSSYESGVVFNWGWVEGWG